MYTDANMKWRSGFCLEYYSFAKFYFLLVLQKDISILRNKISVIFYLKTIVCLDDIKIIIQLNKKQIKRKKTLKDKINITSDQKKINFKYFKLFLLKISFRSVQS